MPRRHGMVNGRKRGGVMSATLTESERRSIGQRGSRLINLLRLAKREPQLSAALSGALCKGSYEDVRHCLSVWDAMDARVRREIEQFVKWRQSPEAVATRLSIHDLEERLLRYAERPHYYTERYFKRIQRTEMPIYQAEYDRRLAACLPAPQAGTDELTDIERMRLEAVKQRTKRERG